MNHYGYPATGHINSPLEWLTAPPHSAPSTTVLLHSTMNRNIHPNSHNTTPRPLRTPVNSIIISPRAPIDVPPSRLTRMPTATVKIKVEAEAEMSPVGAAQKFVVSGKRAREENRSDRESRQKISKLESNVERPLDHGGELTRASGPRGPSFTPDDAWTMHHHSRGPAFDFPPPYPTYGAPRHGPATTLPIRVAMTPSYIPSSLAVSYPASCAGRAFAVAELPHLPHTFTLPTHPSYSTYPSLSERGERDVSSAKEGKAKTSNPKSLTKKNAERSDTTSEATPPIASESTVPVATATAGIGPAFVLPSSAGNLSTTDEPATLVEASLNVLTAVAATAAPVTTTSGAAPVTELGDGPAEDTEALESTATATEQPTEATAGVAVIDDSAAAATEVQVAAAAPFLDPITLPVGLMKELGTVHADDENSILVFCHRLGLPPKFALPAAQLFTIAAEKRIFLRTGEKNAGFAACIIVICRVFHLDAVSLKETIRAMRVGTGGFVKKSLDPLGKFVMNRVPGWYSGSSKPRVIIQDWVKQLELPQLYAVAVTNVVRTYVSVEGAGQLTPSSNAGASIGLLAHFYGHPKTLEEVARTTTVKKYALKKIYEMLHQKREVLVAGLGPLGGTGNVTNFPVNGRWE